MPDGWETCSWGDVVILEYGKALNDYRNGIGIYPVYGTNGPIGFHTEALCKQSGVIIGRKGAYRGVHYSNKPFWVIDTAFYLKPKIEMDTRWAYYQLLTQDINAMDSGSAIPSTSRPDFYGLRLQLPPLPEQKIIASILSALDDKIELNRRMNETLESMARALFQSWFVDFDPVRARMAGRQPYGMDAETATQFPCAFANSLLGEIPTGWDWTGIGDIVEFAYGKALIEQARRTGSVPVYGANGQVGWHDETLVTGPGIIIGRKGNPGTVVWAATDFFSIDTTFYVVPKGAVNSLPYLFHVLGHQNLPSLNSDSAVPGLDRNLAYQNKLLVPTPAILDAFDALVYPLFSKIEANQSEIRTLAAIRDGLLPKLMSGELRMREAEQIVEAAL